MKLAQRNLLLERLTVPERHLKLDQIVNTRVLVFCIPTGLGCARNPTMGDLVSSILEYLKHKNFELRNMDVKYDPCSGPERPHSIVCDVYDFNFAR